MILDIAVLAVLLISSVVAFLRGFIREALTILGVIGGLFCAYVVGPVLSPIVAGWLGVKEEAAGVEPARLFDVIPYPLLADILAYGGVFLVVVIVLSIVSHVMSEALRSVGLGSIDRTLGVAFGLARGAVILGILYMPVHFLVADETKAQWFGGSMTRFYLEQASEILAGLVPDTVKDKMESPEAEKPPTTREKLEQIDLLKKEESEEEGYTDEFRHRMDSLFDLKDGSYNE